MRNYEYYKDKPAVNTILLADGSKKVIEGHVDPPLPDWEAIDRMEAEKAKELGGGRRLNESPKFKVG